MVGIVVDDDVVALPVPVVAIRNVGSRDLEVPALDEEPLGGAAVEPEDVLGANRAAEVDVGRLGVRRLVAVAAPLPSLLRDGLRLVDRRPRLGLRPRAVRGDVAVAVLVLPAALRLLLLLLRVLLRHALATDGREPDGPRQNTNKDHIDSARVSRLTVKVVGPSDANLSFISTLELDIQAPNLPLVRIAEIASIPAGATSVDLQIDDQEIAPYAKADSFSKGSATQPPKDTTLEADLALHIVANVL